MGLARLMSCTNTQNEECPFGRQFAKPKMNSRARSEFSHRYYAKKAIKHVIFRALRGSLATENKPLGQGENGDRVTFPGLEPKMNRFSVRITVFLEERGFLW